MAISGPGTMSAPFTIYHRGQLGDSVALEMNHDTNTASLSIRRAGKSARIVRIPGEQAEWFAHLTLHRHDLRMAKSYLAEFDRLAEVDDTPPTVLAALWESALIAVVKCFTHNVSRISLDQDTVFGPSEPTITPERADFNHLKYLRNKHIAHDENDWAQALPLGIIDNHDSDEPTIGSIQGLVIRGESNNADNIARLNRSVEIALTWVEGEWNQVADQLKADLEAMSADELAALPGVTGTLPNEHSVKRTRP